MKINAGWALLGFFVLGWAYYMVSTILMKGTIFVSLRGFIGRKADESRFFRGVQSMLGCLMCTATEASLWTLGLVTFILGWRLHFPGSLLSALVSTPVSLSWFVEGLLMLMISFAISVAVSGEAWAIKTIVEHQEVVFLVLRETFRRRELELLARVQELEVLANGLKNSSEVNMTPVLSQSVIIPLKDFAPLFNRLSQSGGCKHKWCRYSRTTCHVRELREATRTWWKKVHGDLPGFASYEAVFQNAISRENKLYWAFWTDGMQGAEKTHKEFVGQLDLAFSQKPLDSQKFYGPNDAWK